MRCVGRVLLELGARGWCSQRPSPGLSRRYYAGHRDYAGEVDHAALIVQLEEFDGWALSTSARVLQDVLALCPPGVRVAPWVRGERPTRSAGPLNAWEPVIFAGGRRDTSSSCRRDTSPPGQHDASSSAEDDASGVDGRRIDALVHFSRPRGDVVGRADGLVAVVDDG